MRTRLLPQLSFAYDDREEKRQEMDELIRRARATDSDRGANPEPLREAPAPAPDER